MATQTDLTRPAISLPRPAIHRTGTDMAVDLLKTRPDDAREAYILQRVLEGHVPTVMTELRPIEIKFIGGQSKKTRTLTVFVSGDYLSIGDDLDYIRVPLSPLTAQTLFDTLGCVFPTVKLVDEIWKNADIKVDPLPWGPPYDASMMSSDRLVRHSHRIDEQLKGFSGLTTKLLAGHKKDVVVTDLLRKKPDQVAIYGWHQKTGKPIQPLYLGHESTYKDYSHGHRLVSREIWLDSTVCVDIINAMSDPETFSVFGSEPSLVWRQPSKAEK